MKVLVADKFEKSGLDGLKALGCEVLNEPDLKDEALAARLAESEAAVLIVRSTKVTREMLEGSKLSLVVRAGAGYNTIDVAAASERGILVTNCPGKNSIAVAELAFGLLIACDRHIPDNVIQLREGKWNKKGFSKAGGLYGKTLGLVGMGNIGQEMVTRAKAFGMRVVAYSRWMTADVAAAMGIGYATSPEELAERCDCISVHVALTPQTKGSIGKAFFDKMKPGGIFINTSRAEVVDQAALEAAVKEKGISAGLDVFDGEPAGGDGTYEGSLRDLPGVYGTHHIGASTDQAQEAVAEETVRIVSEFKSTGIAPNVVKAGKGSPATHVLIVRHSDKAGIQAAVFGAIQGAGLNAQETEVIALAAAKSTITQVSVDVEPSAVLLGKLKEMPGVFDASTVPYK
ncbi:MAG TPA: 3-phosphoglycerate dehydrogenase [Fimbriimonadaceae bacterium]|nr:3-phosphoglycerate dehydrogenase [Fimbriimonadaceae bacterium]